MPTYEYRCEKGHSFEVFQRMSDVPVAVCETCGEPVQRVMHSPAVHFKGSGFYTTDYGSKRRNRELRDAAELKGKYEKEPAASASGDAKSEDSNGGKPAPAKPDAPKKKDAAKGS